MAPLNGNPFLNIELCRELQVAINKRHTNSLFLFSRLSTGMLKRIVSENISHLIESTISSKPSFSLGKKISWKNEIVRNNLDILFQPNSFVFVYFDL